MNYEKVLENALGENWQEHKEIGTKILDYVSANPEWEKVPDIDFEREWEIYNECVMSVMGKPVSFYIQKCRERWLVDARRILWTVYRETTDRPWALMQQKFPMNRSTLIHLARTWHTEVYEKELRDKYAALKKLFIQRLNDEKSN